ncbi:MAG: VOC family protein [Chloroflexi bacterium]|nr:VOC family protein [Chloroflexota bacterium]
MVGPGDGNAIELLQYLEPYGEVRPDQNVRYRPGSAHAAFIVDDVAAWRIKLKAAGIVCMGSEEERDVPYPFLRLAIYFQDPDGNWLEMGQRDPDPATPS